MNQRERLIELIENAKAEGHSENLNCSLARNGFIADFLLANGVIVPPCKVGDAVYVLTSDSQNGIEETKVSQIKIKIKENGKISYRVSAPCVYDDWGEAHWTFCLYEFGKTVFLTREEAEKALAERSGEQ